MKFTPIASSLTTTSSGPGVGRGTSSNRRFSGPPGSWTRMAFMHSQCTEARETGFPEVENYLGGLACCRDSRVNLASMFVEPTSQMFTLELDTHCFQTTRVAAPDPQGEELIDYRD